MAFLDLSTTPTGNDNAPALPAGTHLVSLTKLAYITTKDKALAVFANEEGEYLEWLSTTTDGSRKRTKAFLGHLASLADVKHDLNFPEQPDFDAFGLKVVAGMPNVTIELAEDTWEGKTKSVLAGYFDKVIKPAFDPTADGF